MLTVYDSQNQRFVLTNLIGRGGEGAVYSCESQTLVAKIYHEAISIEKAEKLRWMAANKDENLLKVAAWVVDVLTDKPNGKIVGFLMPNVRAKEIHELYSLKSRRIYFPKATWHFLVHTAANVARAFYALHKNNHVMGDVNHGNCVVLADGTVKLIDCDSYSIATEKTRYPCEVGVATHLAPELQGANLREVERETKHDNFGLAVIIFQLLFLGRHPFAGNYLGAEDKSLEDCIREFRFAYGDNARYRNVKQPPGTLQLSAASPRLALMFERAFASEDRPEPFEWIEALEDLSNNLEQCSLHPGHFYYKDLPRCPWCDIEANTGLMLFPFVNSSDASGEKSFNIFTIENLINSFGVPQNLLAKPPKPSVLPPPSAGALEAKNRVRNRQILVVAIHLVVLIFLVIVSGIGTTFTLGVSFTIYSISYINKKSKAAREEIDDCLRVAQDAWGKLDKERQKNIVSPNFDNDLAGIRKKIGDYQTALQTAIRQKISRDEKRDRRFVKYLNSFRIADAEIPGIEAKDLNALKIWGIKTAANVEESKLGTIFRLDYEAKNKLFEWREKLEKEFNETSNEDADEARFLEEAAGKRQKIENEIEQMLASLRSASYAARHKQRQLLNKSEVVAAKLAQAESDAKVFSVSYAAIVLLLLNLLFFMPITSLVINSFNRPTNSYNRPTYSSAETEYDNYPIKAVPMSEAMPAPVNYDVPDENITDEEISNLSEAERMRYANNLFYRANVMFYGTTKDYTQAEKNLRLAFRLNSGDKKVLDALGELLYKRGSYFDSLKFFQRSLMIDEDNAATKIYIAINYLNLNQPAKAKKILTEVTETNPSLQAGFFNLGLANENLKNYAAAVENFRQAVVLDPSDVDARYELVVCFYKSGDASGARGEFQELKNINADAAKRLQNQINIR